jgi:hypothetical protein
MGNEALQDLMTLERREGVKPVVGVWPSLELVARLLDPDPSEGRSALAALKRIAAHCGSVVDGRGDFTFAADHELTLIVGLFGTTIPSRPLTYQAVASLLARFTAAAPPERGEPSYLVIEQIAGFVAQRESLFAESMGKVAGSVRQLMATTGLSNQATRAQIREVLRSSDALGNLAELNVLGIAQLYGATPTDADIMAMRQLVLMHFPVAMSVLRRLLEKAVVSDAKWDLPRNANSLWDLWLSYHASGGSIIEGVPILLVTEDTLILEAAQEVGHEAFVAREEEYRKVLAEGKVPDREAIMLAVANRRGRS